MIMTFDDRLLATSRAAPSLDPSLHYAIASGSQDEADAVAQAQQVEAFGSNVKWSSTFNGQDPWVQQMILNHLTPPAAASLLGAGAKPKPHKSGGLIGGILGGVGDVLSTVEHATGTAVGETLHALGAPLRAYQHTYRMTNAPTDNHELWFMHPDKWADYWNETENGEQTFHADALRQLSRKYGDQQVEFGKQVAGGTPLPDIVKNVPQDQRVQLYEQSQTPEFKQLLAELEASKISPGRDMVGRALLVHSPKLPKGIPVLGDKTVGSLLSGATDAVNDAIMDPSLYALKGASALRASRYLVSSEDGAATVDRLVNNNASVKRLLGDVSDRLQSGDSAGLLQRYPKFAEVIPEWTQRGITTQEQLGKWFTDAAETGAMFDGKVGGMVPKAIRGTGEAAGVMPHLSMTQQVAINAKQKFTQAVDWAAERGPAIDLDRLSTGAAFDAPLTTSQRVQLSVIDPAGRALKSLTALVPPGGTRFDLNSPDFLTYVQRYARMGGMEAAEQNKLVNAAAMAADEAGKRNVFKSTVMSSMRGMGVDDGYIKNWGNAFDSGMVSRSYAPAGIDKMQLGNETISAAVLENQLAHTVDLPDYRAMLANVNRTGMARAAWGITNNDMVTAFMNKAWKPITLLRLGFPIRAGGEEAVGQMLREGVGSYLGARNAASSLARAAESGPVESSMIHALVGHLPEEVQLRINDATDMAAYRWHENFGKSMGKVQGAVSSNDALQAAREIAEMHPGALPQEISAAHGIPGYFGSPETATSMTKNGEKVKRVFAPTGGFREYSQTDPGQLTAWSYSLDQMAKDRLGQQVLKAADLPREEAVSNVADFLQSKTFEESWSRATRSKVLRDGSQVGVDATERAAAEDWASTAIDHANALTQSAEGERVIDPASLIASGQGPNMRQLEKIAADRRPTTVGGPEVMPVADSAWQSFLNHGFDRIVGRPMNWISRQPMFIQNYAMARKDLEGLRGGLENLARDDAGVLSEKAAGEVETHLKELASKRALNETIPFIHNPEVRSQFAVYTRNLMPFWFAQEQFIKRWATTFVHSPEAFRKGQLAMMGLRHAGVVHRDENGSEVFTYPGVDLTADALSALTSWVSGNKVRIPQPLTFNGQVKFATPGTERLGVPSFGPLVSVPLSAMVDRFPELGDAQQKILGDRGAGRGYLEQIVPTTVTRVAKIFMADPDRDAQMASAQKQALQYLAAHGEVPDEGATPQVKEKFLEDLRWTARTIAMLRTVYGFAAPAAPEAVIDPDHITAEFRQLLGSGIPISDAVNELVKAHPNETVTPYTVFQSRSVSHAPLPASDATLNEFQNNRDFYEKYPMAAAWLLPQTDKNNPNFNMAAYRESIALGLRQRKAPSEMLDDIYYAQAAQDFFDSLSAKKDMLAAHQGPGGVRARQNINQNWATWQGDYFAMHPVFADKYQSDQGHLDRGNALDQLHAALVDPASPQVPHAPMVTELLANFDSLGDQLSALRGQRTTRATQRKQSLTNSFTNWAENYVRDHPEVEGIYHRLIAPEMP